MTFTLDRYAQVMPGMQEKEAGKLEAVLFGQWECRVVHNAAWTSTKH